MLHRLINMKDIELYEIKEMLYSDVRYYMLLLDFHRPSRYEDFSFIPNYEEEDFESRGNFMAAYILYDSELTNNEMEEAYEIASGFLEDKNNCAWVMHYKKIDFKDLYPIYDFTSDIVKPLNDLLEMVGYEKKIDFIDEKTFDNLSQ